MLKKVFALFIVVVMLCSVCIITTGCSESPDKYTLEEHIERISERVEKRYFGEDTKYTGYAVYPLYNEEDKLKYFLVELDPYGFVFVATRKTVPFTFGMYVRNDTYCKYSWQHYRICIDGQEPEPYDGKQWLEKEKKGFFPNGEEFRFEIDNNGEFIEYTQSPYKVASVLDEKMYLLDIKEGYVPAIKKDGKFINLISLEKIDYLGREWYYETMEYNYTYFHIPHLPIQMVPERPL